MFDSFTTSEIVSNLQSHFTHEVELDCAVIEKISILRSHSDPGVRFWARKVFNKYAVSQLIREPSQEIGDSFETDILQKKLLVVQESTFLAISVLEQILKKADPHSFSFLISHLKSTRDLFQISFLVKHLCQCFPTEDLLHVVVPYLKHSDDRVVANAIEGIEQLNTERGIPFFSEMLRHRNQRVRANAAKALFRFNREKTFKALSRMLKNREEPRYVLAACFAVRELKDPRYLPILCENLGYRLLFDDTLTAMKMIGTNEAKEAIFSRRNDFKYYETQMAKILGEIKTEEAIKSPWYSTFKTLRWLTIVILLLSIAGYLFFPSPKRLAMKQLAEMSISLSNQTMLDAILSENLHLVELLLTAGISPLGVSEDGTPFFHSAIFVDNIEIFKKLQGQLFANNPDYPNKKLMDQILKIKNSSGETLLHAAVNSGKIKSLRYMLDSSFDPTVKDEKGNGLIHAAVDGDQEEVLVLLLTQKLKVDEKNNQGLTPLHLAVLAKRPKMVYWLIKLGGADPKQTTDQNLSAIDLGLYNFYSD